MQSGGKGFSAFLMIYSLAQGYLDGDEFKEIIESGVTKRCNDLNIIKQLSAHKYKNKHGVWVDKEIDEV